jgi:hypothetical protein
VALSPLPDHWLPGFNYNVEQWFERDRYETLAICRSLALARAAFEAAVKGKPAGWFMIRQRDSAWCGGTRRAIGESGPAAYWNHC